jgi:hypothetical protein
MIESLCLPTSFLSCIVFTWEIILIGGGHNIERGLIQFMCYGMYGIIIVYNEMRLRLRLRWDQIEIEMRWDEIEMRGIFNYSTLIIIKNIRRKKIQNGNNDCLKPRKTRPQALKRSKKKKSFRFWFRKSLYQDFKATSYGRPKNQIWDFWPILTWSKIRKTENFWKFPLLMGPFFFVFWVFDRFWFGQKSSI